MSVYPLKLRPTPSERLWGGDRLKRFVPGFANLTTREPLGEAWLVYAENEVLNGLHEGRTLQAVADELGEQLLGTHSVARYGTQVPLLAKFLDAADKLSVQVHPDDQYARAHEADTGYLGKTEAWYILAAEPGASIVWDVKKDVTKEAIRAAVAEGTLENLLRVVPVQAGDVVYNPAGTLHAVGAGVLLFEIQQSSDLTYRLYDYGRTDASGEARELHVDKGLEVLTFQTDRDAKVPPRPLSEHVTQLVRSNFFVMEKWEVVETLRGATAPTSLETLTVLEGEITVTAAGESVTLARAESAALPALLGPYQLAGRGTLLRCYLP